MIKKLFYLLIFIIALPSSLAAMGCLSYEEEKEIFPVSKLPIDLQIKIFTESLEIDPQILIIDNLKNIFPLISRFAIKNKLNDYQKNFIYGKISKLIKDSYAKANINESSLINAEINHPKAIDVAQILLNAGVDINAIDSNGESALFRAVRYNSLGFIQFLVKNGAEINIQDKYANTPLSYAAGDNTFEVVQFLIDNNAQVNLNEYILKNAVSSKIDSLKKTKFLIDKGANLNNKVYLDLGSSLKKISFLQWAKDFCPASTFQLIKDKLKEQSKGW